MKRTLLFILALAALFQLPVFAREGEEPGVETAYYQDGILYAFARFPGYEEIGEQLVELKNGAVTYDARNPWKLTQQKEPVQYLFLIDCSGSMQSYGMSVQALAETLLRADYPTEVSIAAFGEDFRVVREHLTSTADVWNTMAQLRYSEAYTDIGGAGAKAIRHVCSALWEPGMLSNVILFTDGQPDYAKDKARAVAEAAKELEEALENAPQVIFHSVCFGRWEETTYKAVSSAGGLHLTPGRDGAAKAGAEIDRYYDGLYRLEYRLPDYTEGLALKVQDRVEPIPITRVGNLDREDFSESAPVGLIGSGEPEEAAPPADSHTPEETEKPRETHAPEETAKPTETVSPEESVQPEKPEPAEPEQGEIITVGPLPEPEGERVFSPLVIALIAAGGFMLLVIILLLILLLRKRGRRFAPAAAAPAAASGQNPGTPAAASDIPMRLEVLYGDAPGSGTTFRLAESLMIGRDARCDVVLPDAGVAPVHARVFRQDGRVMIEDLNSATGTALGGMRLYAPNILRSGDQLLIGSFCIAFYF